MDRRRGIQATLDDGPARRSLRHQPPGSKNSPRSQGAVAKEEGSAHVAKDHHNSGRSLDQCPHAQHSCRNKHSIRGSTNCHDPYNVPPQNSLAQDKGVLCSDDDNKRKACGESGSCGLKELKKVHDSTLKPGQH